MYNLLLAEWKKTTSNRMLSGFLVWIYPIGVGAFFTVTLLVSLVSERSAQAMVATSSGQWTTDITGVFVFISAFPGNIFGRMLPLAFMAVVFAGEYQWGTWKNLVPRSRRPALILAKFITLTSFIMLSLLITSLLTGIGQGLGHKMIGAAYGPSLNVETLLEYAPTYAQQALLALTSLVILGGFAALSALLTRSILGGLLSGFGFSVVEPMSLGILFLLGKILNRPEVINLYQYTPTYNLDNIRSWFAHHSAAMAPLVGFTAQPKMPFSLVVLAIWVSGLVALSIYIFQQQDITA
jgi:ABC-type transport system involved in multi-copper enzyme maturation permease subunit